jgi:hypothetical protein
MIDGFAANERMADAKAKYFEIVKAGA